MTRSWLTIGITAGIVVALVAAIGATPPAPAQTPAVRAFSIDMVTSGNTATSVGPRQECSEALPGANVTIDVTIEDISPATPMFGYAFTLLFPGPTITVTGREQMLIRANAGSSTFDASEPLPQFDGSWDASAVDIGDPDTAFETGSGVLDRITLEIGTDAAPAIHTLSLIDAAIVSPDGEAYLPQTINNARLAIGVSCSASTPAPPVQPTPPGGGPTAAPPPTAPRTSAPTPPPDGATDGPGAGPTASPRGTGETGAPGTSPSPADGASPSPSRSPSGSPSLTPGADEGSGGNGGPAAWVIVLIFVAVAGGGGAAWFGYRWYRLRGAG